MGIFLDKQLVSKMKNEINLLRLDEGIIRYELSEFEKLKHKIEQIIKLLSQTEYAQNKKELIQAIHHILEQLHHSLSILNKKMIDENHTVFAKIFRHVEKIPASGASKELAYYYASVAKLFKIRYRAWSYLATHLNKDISDIDRLISSNPKNAVLYFKEMIEHVNRIEAIEKKELDVEIFLEKDIEKIEHKIIVEYHNKWGSKPPPKDVAYSLNSFLD